MIAFWITQFVFQNLTQERDLLTVKMYPKKQKSTIKKVHFWVGNIVYHTPWYISVISYTKRMVPVYDFYL
jgi:hypothetical protein